MKPWYWLWIVIWFTSASAADQLRIAYYQDAEKLFWGQLYPHGGWTLYCGDRFDNHKDVVIEEIYAREWVMDYLHCDSLEQCRSQHPKFASIESDLHNLYPALKPVSKMRADYSFGPIAGEFRDYFECNFEYDARDHIVEPRAAAQGNIARAILYMHREYGLPVEKGLMVRALQWNQEDPPSRDEIRRNDLIERLQGTRNPFIDHPEQAEKLLATHKGDAPSGEVF